MIILLILLFSHIASAQIINCELGIMPNTAMVGFTNDDPCRQLCVICESDSDCSANFHCAPIPSTPTPLPIWCNTQLDCDGYISMICVPTPIP